MAVRDDLSHLPEKQRSELARATKILMEEFDKAIALGNSNWKREGRILKVILFGSYARSDWVDDPENGYQSDFDLLIVVSHEKLTDIAEYWYIAEDKILRDEAIDRQINIIVHDLSDVNQALQRGEYFWADIVRDGIALYELPHHALSTPKPLSKFDAVRLAERYLRDTSEDIEVQLETVRFQSERGFQELKWRRAAAFSLHQAVEKMYACFLLTTTFYFPRSHNVKFLRSLSEGKCSALIEAWPRASKMDRRRFELLKRAYVEARYSPNFTISAEDLDTLYTYARRLRSIVSKACEKAIEELARG